MTKRDIGSALMDLNGVTISHRLIAQVTGPVLEEARLWQTRPPEAIYPIVWLDRIVVKVRLNEQAITKSAHMVLGVNLRGYKKVRGLWLAENEGSEFWLAAFTELRERGVQDIYIASMDGLKGLPEAVNTVFLKTLTQLCIVDMARANLRCVCTTHSRAVVSALWAIYQLATADGALRELDAFKEVWGVRCKAVMRLWRSNWNTSFICSSCFRRFAKWSKPPTQSNR